MISKIEKIHELKTLALAILYDEFVNDRKEDTTLTEMKNIIGEGASKNLSRITLQALVEDKFCKIDSNSMRTVEENVEFPYHIRVAGINEYRNNADKPGSPYFRASQKSTDFLREIRAPSSVNPYANFASVAWEPLAVDRENPAYIEAVKNLEETIKVIEGDNGFAAAEPENRNSVLASLRSGLDLIKYHIPERTVIRSLVMRPLNWLISRFSSALIGEAAKKAAESVIKWLAGSS